MAFVMSLYNASIIFGTVLLVVLLFGQNRFAWLISCANVIIGIILMFILLFLQGPLFGLIIGSFFIILNLFRSLRRIYVGIVYFFIIPLSVLFSINIIMLGIDPNVSAGFRTPLPVGLIILLPLWSVIFVNLKFSRINPKKTE